MIYLVLNIRLSLTQTMCFGYLSWFTWQQSIGHLILFITVAEWAQDSLSAPASINCLNFFLLHMLPLKLTALRHNESLMVSSCGWYFYSQCWATHKAGKTKQVSEEDRGREGSVVGGLEADVSHIHIQTSRKLDPPPTIHSTDREGLVGLLLGSINCLRHTNNDRSCQASINIIPRRLQIQQLTLQTKAKQMCSHREVTPRIRYVYLLETQMVVLVKRFGQCLQKMSM